MNENDSSRGTVDSEPVSTRLDEERIHDGPTPELRIVEGVATIDDLDAFLAEVRAIAERTNAVVQTFDAGLVVSRVHLSQATRLAARAIARGEAVAREPAVEVLLYAAGRRQIDRALEMGVSTGTLRVVALVADFGDVPGANRERADLDAAAGAVADLLEGASSVEMEGGASTTEAEMDRESTRAEVDTDRVRTFYDVTDRELAATDGDLADVVLERVALLDVEK